MTSFASKIVSDGEWIDASVVEREGLGLAGMWRVKFERLMAAKRERESQLDRRPGVISVAASEYARDPSLHGQFGSRASFVDARLRTMGIPALASDEAAALNSSGRIL